MAAAESTWGIAPQTRRILSRSILELRAVLEDDARRQLAALGITETRIGDAPASLPDEDARLRRVAVTVVQRSREAGDSLSDAVARYVRETAFTFLDRTVALRCLEERELLLVDGQPETVIKLDPVRGSSSLVWRVRNEQPSLPPREVARQALIRACAAVSERIRFLFDPDDEHAALFPLFPTWERVVAAFNAPDVPSETYAEDEVLGWVYQYWNSAAKDAVYAKLQKSGKIETPEELSAASCLYTERYIVDYLVQNTLGTLWVEMRPDSRLPESWLYYVQPPTSNPRIVREPKPVREITLLDPACGSGHFLVRAFDLFVQLYAEEGIEDPAKVPALILEHNLHGIDIDRRAVQIAALALYMKGRALAGPTFHPGKLNLVAADIVLPPTPPDDFVAKFDDADQVDLAKSLWKGLQGIRDFGSLLHPERTVNEALNKLRGRYLGGLWAKDDAAWDERRAHLVTELRRAVRRETGETDLAHHLFGAEAGHGLDLLQVLGRHYDVVVANPPYAGSANLTGPMKSFMAVSYEAGKRDLYAAFMLRCEEFAAIGAQVGMVTQHSWMFLRSYADLRQHLLTDCSLTTIAHLGEHAFEEHAAAGAFVVAFTFRRDPSPADQHIRAFRLVGLGNATSKRTALASGASDSSAGLLTNTRDILAIPETPIVYWLRPNFFALLQKGSKVSDVADVKQGLVTADNDRFTRCFWEVTGIASGHKHAPHDRWYWYAKGGGYSKWAGLEWLVVDWAEDGEAIRSYVDGSGKVASRPQNTSFFFRPGLTYTFMARGKMGVRRLDDQVFDLASMSLFAPEPALAVLLPLLNGRVATYLLRVTTQNIMFHAGYVSRLPMPNSVPDQLVDVGRFCWQLKRALTASDLVERSFVDARPLDASASLLHLAEGWNERMVCESYGLNDGDVAAVLDETGKPAGWFPLLAGYDSMPELANGIHTPAGIAEYLATLERREFTAHEIADLKARLRRLYEAGSGAKDEDASAPSADQEEGPALGARIPIPPETFVEELSQRLEIHPVSVHWLLEEIRSEGCVSSPERRRELTDSLSVTLLRMLGYKWPEQDAYESDHGPLVDPDLIDDDGIIPLVSCADEPTAEERIRTGVERALGDSGSENFLRDVRRYLGRDLGEWLRREWFKQHIQQFKNRPIAWHFRSPAGHFEALVFYHRLSRPTLQKLRTTYAGGRIARLRADQARARERADMARVADLQVAVEDIELFRTKLEAIERGDALSDRIRCPWKGEVEAGRPGPYAPDIDDGVKVNIRPFQDQGLLAAKVIAKW